MFLQLLHKLKDSSLCSALLPSSPSLSSSSSFVPPSWITSLEELLFQEYRYIDYISFHFTCQFSSKLYPFPPNRLDVERLLSENLKVAFFRCNSEDRLPLLFHLLQNVISSKEQSVIFVATSHHVEYLQSVSYQGFCFSRLFWGVAFGVILICGFVFVLLGADIRERKG